MRDTPNRGRSRHDRPISMHSFRNTVVGSALTLVGTVALVLAVLYPVAATGVLALAVGGGLAVHQLRRARRTRLRAGRARRVCIPKTGVCVEL